MFPCKLIGLPGFLSLDCRFLFALFHPPSTLKEQENSAAFLLVLQSGDFSSSKLNEKTTCALDTSQFHIHLNSSLQNCRTINYHPIALSPSLSLCDIGDCPWGVVIGDIGFPNWSSKPCENWPNDSLSSTPSFGINEYTPFNRKK